VGDLRIVGLSVIVGRACSAVSVGVVVEGQKTISLVVEVALVPALNLDVVGSMGGDENE
ncbi:hypothetical protein A2U01_0114894, partial [Trifolium medium]|nr:hypothetical protein [Trifolium medium]